MKKGLLVLHALLVLNAATAQNRWFDSTKALLSQARTDSERIAILDTLGGTIYLFTFPDTSLRYAYQELALARKFPDSMYTARALGNCAWCCITLGRYIEALGYTIRLERVAARL